MSVIKRTVWFLAALCICLVVLITYILHDTVQKFIVATRENYLRKLDDLETEDIDEDTMFHKFRKTYSMEDKIIDINNMMKLINEKQRIRNAKRLGLKDINFETVLVVKIHNNIRHLAVFLESLRKMRFITKSLLICAHDFYDYNINMLLKRIPYVNMMRIFYPYSTQIYPNLYPGRDARFCEQVNTCITSNRRNHTLAQSKLFWWWVTSQVFDHIEVLKKYDGYIYFLDSEQYLTSDFIHMAKMLEKLQLLFCPECRILSLSSRSPQPEVYSLHNSTLVVDAWGSNYSNSAIGFNRRTWYEIVFRKQEFCYFNDSSWDRSLQHLISTTQENKFLMLSPEGPRAFSTKDCGSFKNGTGCTLERVFLDIADFLPTVREGLFPDTFKLKVSDIDMETNTTVEGHGDWEDARDREFCMYLAIRKTRTY